MRASPTSRISSAHLHAAQNKPDTNKSEAASPFALLMQSTASKENAKAPHKDAQDNKPADDKPAVKKDDKTETATQAQAKPAPKAERSTSDDKNVVAKEEESAKTDSTADSQPAAVEPQPVNPQIQQAAQPAITAANDDAGDAEEITAAPAAAAAQDTKAAQNNAAPAPEDQTQNVETGQPAAAKAAAKTATTGDTKTDGVKAAKNSSAANNAADTAAANSTDTKAEAVNAVQNDKLAAAPDAAASRQTTADNNHFAASPITAPQAPQPAQAAALTQHVQVTAQPTPNVPALAVQIVAKSQSGAKQFDIRLDPPELGRVEVRLSIDATGKASAHLSADQPQTLDLLQKDAPALTRALREAGLDVSQDGLNFSLRHQAGQDGGANHGGSRGSARGFTLAASTSIEATAASAAYRAPSDGRLDIRV